eukprot:INCI15740.1.p1 GENE.INCI15740.1~~INCI15740.1.p1  ORF type:complete len:382 (-),score=45.72 INCI15740.1:172-1317(-)
MSTSGRGISGPSPALEARILRERRSEEKRRKRQARAAGASFEPVTVKVLGVERRLLFWLQENRTKLWAARQALNVTSATPFQDICTITSVSACIGLFAIGFPFFWMCAYAAIAFFAVNLFLRYPRPQTLDQRLVPLTRTSQDVICQEAFSAAVVFGTVGMYLSEEEGALPSINGEATDVLLFFDWAYVVQQLLLLGLVVFVSWTRVVACAKYPSQVVAAWVCAVPLLILWRFSPHLFFWPKRLFRAQLTAACFVGAIGVLYFAYLVEHNLSSVVGVRREEYLRVLNSIMSEETDTSATGVGMRQEDIARFGAQAKTDSFVYMLRGMERREKRLRRRRNALRAAGADGSASRTGFDTSSTGTDTESDRRKDELRAAQVLMSA